MKKKPETVAAALAAGGPTAARAALARRLAVLVDDEAAPPYATVQAARALGVLLADMLENEDGEEEREQARRILEAVR